MDGFFLYLVPDVSAIEYGFSFRRQIVVDALRGRFLADPEKASAAIPSVMAARTSPSRRPPPRPGSQPPSRPIALEETRGAL
jgi:hypothetical protein